MLSKCLMFILLLIAVLFTIGLSNAETYTVSGNDDTAINNALDEAAKHPGSVVKLNAEKYIISKQIEIHDDTTLEGSGKWGSVLFLATDSNFKLQEALIIMDSRTRITNIHLDCNSEHQANVPWDGGKQMGTGHDNGIACRGADGLEIDNCWLDNSLGDLMRLRSGKNIKIHDNKISRAGHEGIFLIQCEHVEVYDNYILPRDNTGIRLIGGVGIRVFNNNIVSERVDEFGNEQTSCHATQIQNDGGIMRDIEFSYNRFIGSMVSGAWIISKDAENNEDVYIHHNLISYSGDGRGWGNAGIISSGFDGLKIEHNVFDGSHGPCVEFTGYGGSWETPAKATILNNVFVDSVSAPKGQGFGIDNKISVQTVSSQNNCYFNNVAGNTKGCSVSASDYFTNPRTSETLCDIKWINGQWVIPGYSPKELDDATGVYDDVDPVTDEEIEAFDNIALDIINREFVFQAGENDTIILPDGITETPSEATGTIEYVEMGGNYTTFVNIPTDGISEIQYKVDGKTATHTLMIGESTEAGVVFTETSIWDGELSHTGNSLKLLGKVNPEEIEVTCITPKDEFKPELNTTTTEFKPARLHPAAIILILVFVIAYMFFRLSIKHML